MHSDPSLSVRGSIQQRRLDGDSLCGEHGFIIRHIESKRCVRTAIGQGQEVGPADEIVAVEVSDAHASCGTYPHHRLETPTQQRGGGGVVSTTEEGKGVRKEGGGWYRGKDSWY